VNKAKKIKKFPEEFEEMMRFDIDQNESIIGNAFMR